ncbi:MAG: dihydrodipicolinate synthetase [Gemmatimonadetes bacterium]|nr:dihydrodipicolinate synthetase [Gemmatimonadota bacterium]
MSVRAHLAAGQAIPAMPLALTSERTLDERRQRALLRYYMDAGAGGIAAGVHTTQFAIRELGLYEPVLALAASAIDEWRRAGDTPFVRVAGVIGETAQAVREAVVAERLGYDVALLSLAAMRDASDGELVEHCAAVSEVLPLFGFYLQPAVGGRPLSYAFWRALAERVPRLWAIKIAPFNRYQTLDVVRGVADAGRDDVALYTGNDDAIVSDLVTPIATSRGSRSIVGGLLGQWAVWTHSAVRLHAEARAARESGAIDTKLLATGAALTDANAAIFDAANGFAGCIPGIHEILRRQGLLAGRWCLDEHEELSAGQAEEIDRVCRQNPGLADDQFVRENLDRWMA